MDVKLGAAIAVLLGKRRSIRYFAEIQDSSMTTVKKVEAAAGTPKAVPTDIYSRVAMAHLWDVQNKGFWVLPAP